jgi:hypothetical protein
LESRGTDVPESEPPPPLPNRPLTHRVGRFFLEPNAAIRCLVFGLVLQIELAMISSAMTFVASSSPMDQFISALLFAAAFLLGILALAVACVNLLAILVDTSNGKDVIETWPGADFMDWSLDAWSLLTALFAAVLPGVLLGQLCLLAGAGAAVYQWTVAACCAVTGLFAYPVLLLSCLETGSPVNPISRPVWRGLRLTMRRWVLFFVFSAGLITAGVLVWQGRRCGWIALDYTVAVVLVALAMLYFRLLGRLAWCCEEALYEAGPSQEETAADDDTTDAEGDAEAAPNSTSEPPP